MVLILASDSTGHIVGNPVKTALLQFDLPDEAIAQVPGDRRDNSRLLLIDRRTGNVSDQRFCDLPDILIEKVLFVRNNARVLKARLPAVRGNGGSAECLLLNPAKSPEEWWCLLKPGKKIRVNDSFCQHGEYTATVIEKDAEGRALVRFQLHRDPDVASLAERIGQMPLPPYIRRDRNPELAAVDEHRYQTVYAARDKTVAVAAPTAGLHFTEEVIRRLQTVGHDFADLTLHVGLGTFRPIQTEDVEQHVMHEECYEIPSDTLRKLHHPDGKRILAVGTTALRTIEDAARKRHLQSEAHGGTLFDSADLFIYPPAEFHTDALLTNFHLPKSTLICLVAAFLTPGSTDGIQWCKDIYLAALRLKYRFYSYGDAMLIL